MSARTSVNAPCRHRREAWVYLLGGVVHSQHTSSIQKSPQWCRWQHAGCGLGPGFLNSLIMLVGHWPWSALRALVRSQAGFFPKVDSLGGLLFCHFCFRARCFYRSTISNSGSQPGYDGQGATALPPPLDPSSLPLHFLLLEGWGSVGAVTALRNLK